MKFISSTLLAFVTTGCFGSVKVAPVTVEPIHVTIDVNVHGQPDMSHADKR